MVIKRSEAQTDKLLFESALLWSVRVRTHCIRTLRCAHTCTRARCVLALLLSDWQHGIHFVPQFVPSAVSSTRIRFACAHAQSRVRAQLTGSGKTFSVDCQSNTSCPIWLSTIFASIVSISEHFALSNRMGWQPLSRNSLLDTSKRKSGNNPTSMEFSMEKDRGVAFLS